MRPFTINDLVDRLARLTGSSQLFNPYAPLEDPAATIRRANLTCYLSDIQRFQPQVLILAEAPGYRGCALSGIPITSERIMLHGIEKWGLFGASAGYQQTSGHPQGVAETTATILWGALVKYAELPPVLWNTVPLHPHQLGRPQSNRTPTVDEQRIGEAFIDSVLALFEVESILAVGRIAQRRLAALSHEYIPLRHPAQGGKAEFNQGLRQALAR
jgi:hypothetical protein